MTSNVDVTFPADNVKASKATARAQALIISNEITALQARTSVAGAEAFSDHVSLLEVQRLIRNATKSNLARESAFGNDSRLTTA